MKCECNCFCLVVLYLIPSENDTAGASFGSLSLALLLPDLDALIFVADHQSAIGQLNDSVGTSFTASIVLLACWLFDSHSA